VGRRVALRKLQLEKQSKADIQNIFHLQPVSFNPNTYYTFIRTPILLHEMIRTKMISADWIAYSDDGRFISSKEFFQVADLKRNFDQALKTLCSRLAEGSSTSIRCNISFDIHAHSSPLTAGSTQPEDHPRTIAESDDLSLVLRDRVVDGVLVFEIIKP